MGARSTGHGCPMGNSQTLHVAPKDTSWARHAHLADAPCTSGATIPCRPQAHTFDTPQTGHIQPTYSIPLRTRHARPMGALRPPHGRPTYGHPLDCPRTYHPPPTHTPMCTAQTLHGCPTDPITFPHGPSHWTKSDARGVPWVWDVPREVPRDGLDIMG